MKQSHAMTKSTWFNNKIKTLIQAKSTASNSFRKNSSSFELKRRLESLQERLNVLLSLPIKNIAIE